MQAFRGALKIAGRYNLEKRAGEVDVDNDLLPGSRGRTLLLL